MKTVLILSLLTFLSIGTYAQGSPIDNNTGKVTYAETLNISGKTKIEILKR